MNEDMVIEVEDETLERLTRMAERVGLSVEEFARLLIEQAVRNERTPLENRPV
jgi:antitoxin component of RelBE/YafQ-DinJ toxin-antitoxin module